MYNIKYSTQSIVNKRKEARAKINELQAELENIE